jgi:hypothetical protein
MADTTYIERNSIASWNRDEGTMIYNGSGISYQDIGLSKGTVYYYQAWSWNNTDHAYSTTSAAANATTFATQLPVFSGEIPADNAGNIDINTSSVSVLIQDPDGDMFNWTIQGQYITDTGQNDDANGSKSASLIIPLPYNTNIIWYVNATDGYGWTRTVYNFTTRASYIPSPPSGFTATAISETQINLLWTKGAKADITYIERNVASSWNRGEGTLIYNNTGTSYPDSGLSQNTHYYYRAWSWNNTDHVFSTTSVSDNATTYTAVSYWGETVTINGPGGTSDTVIFGEAENASDGQDTYDVPKPGMPPPPYLYAWFASGLPEPYNVLGTDYRHYPGTQKTWNLTILSSGTGSVTINWNPTILQNSEYTTVTLHDITADVSTNMLTTSSYPYTATSYVPRAFEIICSSAPLEYTYEIPLLKQWNLISFPVNASYDKSDIMVERLDVNYTWTEAVSAGILLNFIYEWNESAQSYLLTDTFTPGDAFWLFAYNNCSLWITGEKNNDDHITNLLSQWNFIGVPFDESTEKQNLIINYNGTDYNWTQATTGSNPTGQPLVLQFLYAWSKPGQSYLMSDTLDPGYGYWMYSYHNCILDRGI